MSRKYRWIGLMRVAHLALSISLVFAHIGSTDHAGMPCCQDSESAMPVMDYCDQCSAAVGCGVCAWSATPSFYWIRLNSDGYPTDYSTSPFTDFFPPLELKPPRWSLLS